MAKAKLGPLQCKQLAARLRQARIGTFGSKGAARFARAVGVLPSTYRRYETTRLPPVAAMAQLRQLSFRGQQ